MTSGQTAALTDRDKQALERALQAERERQRRLIQGLEELGLSRPLTETLRELSSYDNFSGDLGSETFERGKDVGLREQAKLVLGKIDDAFERLAAGSYGRCELCGRPIPRERLFAIPYATLCAECKTAEEAGEAESDPRRPVEEEVLSPPFGRTFHDRQEPAPDDRPVVFDGEDAWQAVAAYGNANSPQDEPPAVRMEDAYTEADEPRGPVQPPEAVSRTAMSVQRRWSRRGEPRRDQ